MDWQSQLINVYLTTCDFFSQLSPTSFLKISPNSNPSFTDQEVVTIYIFGVLMKQKNIKDIFNFTKNFIPNWFPHLPSYEGFLSRLNSLSKLFRELANFILKNNKFKIPKTNSQPFILIDSLPIMLTTGFRAHKCNTANDISAISYCSSKDKFYYGLKLHLAALFQNKKLASPIDFKITSAATHDLTAVKNDLLNFKHSQIFADRAYCDQSTKKNLSQINSKLHTPIKLSRNKKTLSSDEKVYSKSVSSIRQSIEILFNWLIESSGIQIASKVRSTKGLIVHVFGRFSACLFNYLFKF
jgi:hypothetical protein